MRFFLVIAAIIIFALVVILWLATDKGSDTLIGLTALGLGVWAASTIAPANVPR